ncbi:LysR family transcriptional regulator [Lactiplantibacillus daowaiensis]|uniref:LysR family transcriptional regulator n=1 Tax=Lactiplantibacillus daowaiensis TaxID=2559918 RepID=A0ABW1S4Y0_9LACO|nr:LysR family transcriptional regulator [Lactiplantibacillus daowaiensis]
MNLEHLKLFTNLAETLNFSQTSQNLHITQPAVTQAINSLENELGFKLFKRNKRQVKLTTGGQLFYEQAQPLLIKLEAAVENARHAEERKAASISIGYTSTYYEIQRFPQLITEFNKLHPETHIFLENFNHNLLKQHLINQECDVTFPMQDSIADTQNIHFIPLITGRFACIVPNNNPLARKDSIDITDLNGECVIVLNANQCPPRQFALQQIIKRTCPDTTYLYSDSVMLSHTMVQGGLGIAVMVNLASLPDSKQFKVIPLTYPKQHAYTYGMAILKSNSNPVLNDFIRCATKVIGQ